MQVDIVFQIQSDILDGKKEYEGIELPTKQTAGSDYQIQSYAFQQAQTFYYKHRKNLK
tara:strand:+ start:887 stop:1060 length:174 start_codon:yes stop_codon:yes gene_type:complete